MHGPINMRLPLFEFITYDVLRSNHCHRTVCLFDFDRRVMCVAIMLHGIIRIWLYHLTDVELRQRCQERRLVAPGPIRLLRERFSTYVKCSLVETSCYVNMVQASAKTDNAASNNVDPVPLIVDPCSLGLCEQPGWGVGGIVTPLVLCHRKNQQIFCNFFKVRKYV